MVTLRASSFVLEITGHVTEFDAKNNVRICAAIGALCGTAAAYDPHGVMGGEDADGVGLGHMRVNMAVLSEDVCQFVMDGLVLIEAVYSGVLEFDLEPESPLCPYLQKARKRLRAH